MMTKLEQLIKELCPNGVTFSKLEKLIISLKTGLNPRQNFSLNVNGSVYPYITGKDIYDNKINVTERTDMITVEALEIINKRAQLQSGLLLFASTGTGTVGRMAIIDSYNNDWGISETLYAIKVDDKKIGSRYLLHYLYSQNAKSQFEPKISKGSVPHLKVKDLLNVIIPVPPIEVQAEIVKILDEYTESVTALQQELEKELTARKKQYEYYMDAVISRIKNAESKKLDDCLEWITYGFTSPMSDTEEGPWKITAKDVHNGIIDYHSARHTSEEAFEKLTEKCKPSIGDVLLTKDGALGRTAVVTETNICINQSVALLRPRKNLLSSEYLNCLLRSPFYQNKMMEDTGGGTIKHIYITRVNQMMIPVPSLEEQERIVNILDRFNKLCNDISEGLPAEIEARRKQYEYYRDKLLSFKEQ